MASSRTALIRRSWAALTTDFSRRKTNTWALCCVGSEIACPINSVLEERMDPMRKRLGLLLVAAIFGAAALAAVETHAQDKDKSKVKEKKVGEHVLKYEDLKEGTGAEAKKDD